MKGRARYLIGAVCIAICTIMLLPLVMSVFASVKPTADGFLYIDPAQFHADFAADLPTKTTDFMARSQVFLSTKSAGGAAKSPAWKTKPSYAVVATEDRSINPELERFMTKRAKSETIELKASHVVYMSKPKEVAALIEKAAMAK